MIIFMALADGESRLLCGPLTLHTETAIHIAEKMTGAKFKVRFLTLTEFFNISLLHRWRQAPARITPG